MPTQGQIAFSGTRGEHADVAGSGIAWYYRRIFRGLTRLGRAGQLTLGLILVSTAVAHAGPINPTPADCNCAINMMENGGPVMTGMVETFAIFYGDFTSANSGEPITAQQVVANWLSNMNGTNYLNITSVYTGAPNGPVSTDVTYNGSYEETDYLGTSLTDAQILQVVQDAKGGGHLPSVANAVYFVFTAPGISQQQDSQACGWHDGDSSTNTIYSWVGPNLLCDFLGGNVSGNPVGNELTETGSHELFESLTDPFPNSAYSDPIYFEVGDVCTSSNFNGDLNGSHFDLQAIWVLVPSNPNGGVCAQGFISQVAAPEPGSGVLMLSGFAALVGQRLRRRTQ
jgi:hypothetical protein